jgi:hypothetical protein
MVTHMKTTIDIADDLLLRAKELAKENNITLRSLIERGLADVLDANAEIQKKEIVLPTFGGSGVDPEYEKLSSDEKVEVMYGLSDRF